MAGDAGVPEVDGVVTGCGEDMAVGVTGTNGGEGDGVDVESGEGLRKTMMVYDGDEGKGSRLIVRGTRDNCRKADRCLARSNVLVQLLHTIGDRDAIVVRGS